jgi:hypothetical protein
MTENQIKWAASHDWYIATLADGEGVLVKDEWVDLNEAEPRQTYSKDVAFTNYRALRDWAGY